MYTVPIYVMEEGYRNQITSASSSSSSSIALAQSQAGNKIIQSQFDVATLVVKVTDVNDHAPEFRPGSCYPLSIPENSDLSVVHTVVATDLDDGPNGDIIYTITGN